MAAWPTTGLPVASETPWTDLYAEGTLGMTSSAIRELLKLTADPGIISFAGACPPPADPRGLPRAPRHDARRAYCRPDVIREGARRLGAVVRRHAGRTVTTGGRP